MQNQQRFVLVTGATSDIGLSIVESLISNGYSPVVVGRNEQKLRALSERLALDSSRCFMIDNSDNEEIAKKFKIIVNSIGKLSGMVLCSGYHELRPLKVQTFSSLFNTFQQNTLSSLMFVKHFSSALNSFDGSSIVFISSTAALLGEAGLSAYSAAKGALISATKSLAVELAPRSLRVNCISPGWVETSHAQAVKLSIGQSAVDQICKQYPLGFGTPTDISNVVEFLLSDKSRWITGQNLVVDGGRTLL